MKLKFSILLLSSVVIFSTSCKDDKDEDKDDKSKKGNKKGAVSIADLGGSPGQNALVFGNMLMNLPNTGVAFKMDVMQLVNNSGIENNAETGLMVSGILSPIKQIVAMDQPLMLTVSGENMHDISVIAMIGVKDKKEFIDLLQSGLGDVAFEETDDYDFGTIQVQQGVRLKVGINNNFCLIHYSDKFMNKEESVALMDSYFEAGMEDADFSPSVDAFLNSEEDFVLSLSPETAVGMLPEEMFKEANININDLKDGWSNFSLDFAQGAIVLKGHNEYPEAEDMNFAGGGLPEEYASLLTTDELYGFGGGSVNVPAVMNMIRTVNKDLGKFERETGFDVDKFAGSFDGTMSVSLIGLPDMSQWIKKGKGLSEADVSDQFADLNDDEPMSDDAQVKIDSEDAMKAADETFKKVVITIGLNDDDMLMSIIDTMPNVKKVGNYFAAVGNDGVSKVGFMAINNDKLMFSGSEEVIKTFANDGKLAMAAEAKPYMSESFNAYVSYDLIRDAIGYGDGAEDVMQVKVLELFKDMVIKGDLGDMSMTITMDDDSSNALEQLVELMMENAGGMEGMPLPF